MSARHLIATLALALPTAALSEAPDWTATSSFAPPEGVAPGAAWNGTLQFATTEMAVETTPPDAMIRNPLACRGIFGFLAATDPEGAVPLMELEAQLFPGLAISSSTTDACDLVPVECGLIRLPIPGGWRVSGRTSRGRRARPGLRRRATRPAGRRRPSVLAVDRVEQCLVLGGGDYGELGSGSRCRSPMCRPWRCKGPWPRMWWRMPLATGCEGRRASGSARPRLNASWCRWLGQAGPGKACSRSACRTGPRAPSCGTSCWMAGSVQPGFLWNPILEDGVKAGDLANCIFPYRIQKIISFALFARSCNVGDRLEAHVSGERIAGTLTDLPFL